MKPGISQAAEDGISFRSSIDGVLPEQLKQILNGSNPIGWWKSFQIRWAWRRYMRHVHPDRRELFRKSFTGS